MSIRDEIVKQYSESPYIVTKNLAKHEIRIRENSVEVVDLPGGRQSIMFATLEKAVELIKSDVRIKGPMDYRLKVKDERPSYAWSILRDLGYVSDE